MSVENRFRLVWTPFLRKRGGRMLQAVGVVCPPSLGAGGELILHVGGQRFTAKPIDLIRCPFDYVYQTSAAVYMWLIPRPSRPVTCRAVWKTPLGHTCRDSLKLRPAEPSTIHAVFKTHFDLGYTAPQDEVLREHRTTLLDRTLDVLDRTATRDPARRMIWTMPAWLLEQCLDAKAVTADRRKRLEAHIRAGRVVWTLAPFTTHSEFFGLEEMCRSLYTARALAERFGVPVPTSARMTDVPSHTAALAMAFVAAGGKFFQIGNNHECRRPDVPPLFWWKLPDESRILCHHYDTYGTPLLPPMEYPYRHWMFARVTDDNVGPPDLKDLDHLDWVAGNFDSPVCRVGRLEDFADALIRDHGRELPKVEGESVDWWIHGIASQAGLTAMTRRDKDRLPSAEIVRTLAAWASGQPVAPAERDEVRRAYEQLSLYTEHTWGDHAGDVDKALPKGNRYMSNVFASDKPAPPVDRWVASWERKARFARDAHGLTDRIESRALDAFAAHLGSDGQIAGLPQTAGRMPAPRIGSGRGGVGIALFNVLGWKRGGLVQMSDAGLPADEFELLDPTTGGAVLYSRENGRIEFIAPPVPPCGYLVLEARPVARRSIPGPQASWDERKLTLHFENYALWFHKKGGMSRCHDRARSVQWCSPEVDYPMGTYLYEMPGYEKIREFGRRVHTNCWPGTVDFFNRREYKGMRQFGPVGGGPATIGHEITPLYARVTVEAACTARKAPERRSGDARRYRTTYTLYRGYRDLHVRLELIGKQPTFAAEAGYAYFPFAGESPWVLVDRIAQSVRPGEDLLKGVNAGHMAVSRGVRIEGTDTGINFYPLDTPLIGFGEPGAYRFDADGKYKTGVLYATLFNNCWGTNFAQWQSGDLKFDFVMRPTGNDDWDGGLARGGAEVFRPLIGRVVTGLQREPARSLLQVAPDLVQVVAIKPADFEAGTVIRLWNADVDAIKARLTLPAMRRGDSLYVCDLLERPARRRVEVSKQGEAVVPMKPNEIVTLLLRPAGKTR